MSLVRIIPTLGVFSTDLKVMNTMDNYFGARSDTVRLMKRLSGVIRDQDKVVQELDQ
ncbi:MULTISPECIES: hypothetical protein [Providencia]|uniref:hypothetical protein n=1 Tax=Providencia TaxID=586 RepID=UPI001639F189|nr:MULTISPECIES: hypothetical protein [Providencia]MBV2189301.1 hypothetical protein [Providencia rettgeri]HEC8324135.1 hypothetical protein [Providencia rettgeri]